MNDNTSFWAYNKTYQPNCIDDLALYPALKNRLNKYVDTQHFPNLMLWGEAGTGKTSAAEIIANAVKGATVDIFDFGRDNSIDNVRRLVSMTERYSLFGGRVIICDEFHDVAESSQRGLKKVIEKSNTANRFIFCVNDIQKVHAPIYTRCTPLQFDYCELDILQEPNVLPHTGWDTIQDWKDELIRVSGIMAGKAGKTITDNQYERTFANTNRWVNVRSFILALEEVITDDEYAASKS
jgi:replication factor C small subunit